MVGRVGWTVVSVVLALGGCAGVQPAPRSDEVILPAWADAPERPARPQTLKIDEPENASHAGKQTSHEELAKRERKKQEAQRSTLLPKSSDSKFFGGCGAMKKGEEYRCSKEPQY
jgi:hypothetical protein